jgi:hypothetical protein
MDLLDSKLLSKPKRFSGKATDWGDFKFGFESWFGALAADLGNILDTASSHNAEVIELTDLNQQKWNRQLYSILATLLDGEALSLVKRVKNKSGLEVWRQLVQKYEEKNKPTKSLAWLPKLLSCQFSAGSNQDWKVSWMMWEQEISEYEKQLEKVFHEDLKMSVLLTKEHQQELENICNYIQELMTLMRR